jgi:hypothetical protein
MRIGGQLDSPIDPHRDGRSLHHTIQRHAAIAHDIALRIYAIIAAPRGQGQGGRIERQNHCPRTAARAAQSTSLVVHALTADALQVHGGQDAKPR